VAEQVRRVEAEPAALALLLQRRLAYSRASLDGPHDVAAEEVFVMQAKSALLLR